jgi:hypothetical protein
MALSWSCDMYQSYPCQKMLSALLILLLVMVHSSPRMWTGHSKLCRAYPTSDSRNAGLNLSYSGIGLDTVSIYKSIPISDRFSIGQFNIRFSYS